MSKLNFTFINVVLFPHLVNSQVYTNKTLPGWTCNKTWFHAALFPYLANAYVGLTSGQKLAINV